MTPQNFKQQKTRSPFSLSAIAAAVLVAAQVLSSSAMAWGIMGDRGLAGRRASYFGQYLKLNKQINFCINNEDPKDFDSNSIELQVRMALSLWLQAANFGKSEVRISRIGCGGDDFNLKIDISPDSGCPSGACEKALQFETGKFYQRVKIDPKFEFVSTNGTNAYTLDFKEVVTDLGKALGRVNFGLLQAVSYVSFENHLTSADVAQLVDTAPDVIFASTYPTLIHELGHAFGLCDTYAGATNCEQFSVPLASQPPSVMSSDGYFYLTTDDIAGIRAFMAK